MTISRGRSVSLDLDGESAGTVLGAIAWVLGALQIMKDRGHAEGDEEFHDLYESVRPKLESLLASVSEAGRLGGEEEEALRQEIEDAYQPLREAFETWIKLTAVDTFSVAAGQRLGDALDSEDGQSDSEL